MDTSIQDPFMPADDWKGRGIALFQFFCFVVLIGVIIAGMGFAIHRIAPGHKTSASILQIAELIMVVSALAATFIMAIATKRPFTRYGFGGSNRVRNFVIGVVSGLALLAALLEGLSTLGVFAFGNPTGSPSSAAYYAVLYAALFLAVGVSEEVMFRGYALVSLSRAISFWPAALVLGALFGAGHLPNGGENFMGALLAFLFAVVMAYSFRVTGSLLFGIGIHAGWDYAESFIFGVPDSGAPALPGCIFHPTIHGPDWLTGGSAGPEGSVLVIVPLLAILLITRLIRQDKTQSRF